jgi:hypothetical protein
LSPWHRSEGIQFYVYLRSRLKLLERVGLASSSAWRRCEVARFYVYLCSRLKPLRAGGVCFLGSWRRCEGSRFYVYLHSRLKPLRAGGVCFFENFNECFASSKIYGRGPCLRQIFTCSCGDKGGSAQGHLFQRGLIFARQGKLYYREKLLPH